MYYPDDFYNEPSEFDMQVEEFKESLAKSIKSDFLEEMERLKAENRKLQGIKENFEQVKRDYERKKQECERVMREAENKAKRMKVEEMLEQFKTIFWRVDWEYLYGPKCDKCDKDRRIEITLPSGNTVKDECECEKGRVQVMVPEKWCDTSWQIGIAESMPGTALVAKKGRDTINWIMCIPYAQREIWWSLAQVMMCWRNERTRGTFCSPLGRSALHIANI